MKQLNQPIAKIKSIKSNGQATAKKARGLWHTLHLAKNAKIRLTENLWTEAGLYNGAPATIYDIIYEHANEPPQLPAVVLIHVPHFKGPDLEIMGKILPKVVPITPFKGDFQISAKNLWRLQLPMKLAWGITIHSSQGSTMEGAWIDLEDREIQAGMTYVALSRLKTLNKCVIEDHDFERLKKCRWKDVALRIAEEQKLQEIQKKTLVELEGKRSTTRKVSEQSREEMDIVSDSEEVDMVVTEQIENACVGENSERKTHDNSLQQQQQGLDALASLLETMMDLDID